MLPDRGFGQLVILSSLGGSIILVCAWLRLMGALFLIAPHPAILLVLIIVGPISSVPVLIHGTVSISALLSHAVEEEQEMAPERLTGFLGLSLVYAVGAAALLIYVIKPSDLLIFAGTLLFLLSQLLTVVFAILEKQRRSRE